MPLKRRCFSPITHFSLNYVEDVLSTTLKLLRVVPEKVDVFVVDNVAYG